MDSESNPRECSLIENEFLLLWEQNGFDDAYLTKCTVAKVCELCAIEVNSFSNELGETWIYIIHAKDKFFQIRISVVEPLVFASLIDPTNIYHYEVKEAQPYVKLGWCVQDDFFSEQQYFRDTSLLNEVKNIQKEKEL